MTLAQTWAVNSIAVDGGDVFWTVGIDPATLPASPIAGGVYRLASGDAGPVLLYGSDWVEQILLDADQVYAVYSGSDPSGSDGAILAVPRAGGPAVTLAAWPDGVSGFAADATNLYLTTDLGMTVSSLSKQGGAVTTLATIPNTDPTDLAVDDVALYWVAPDSGTVNELAR